MPDDLIPALRYRQVHERSCLDSGSERTRLPVAAKMALQTAGITGGSARPAFHTAGVPGSKPGALIVDRLT
jgi:hypothetical protein